MDIATLTSTSETVGQTYLDADAKGSKRLQDLKLNMHKNLNGNFPLRLPPLLIPALICSSVALDRKQPTLSTTEKILLRPPLRPPPHHLPLEYEAVRVMT